MAKIFFLCLFVLGMWAVAEGSRATLYQVSEASAPVNCGFSGSPLCILGCLPFLEDRPISRVMPPPLACCSAVASIVKVNPQCFCEACDGLEKFGVHLNTTRIPELPSACDISASLSCADSPKAPTQSPAIAPAPEFPTPPPHYWCPPLWLRRIICPIFHLSFCKTL